MREKIKEILRENIGKNSLGFNIVKPESKLIIMVGIPGSGKSTKAKTLVGEGKIHSTDDVIESKGDYRLFFETMIASNDFTNLSRAHSTNLNNAIKSMVDGVSPVIVDNTNIKANESKAYVVKALQLGYADENILIVDIGTAGLDAKILAERNTHGVPLDKIESMIKSYNSVGGLTLKKILESADMYKQSDVLYSAVVLDQASKNLLLEVVGDRIPEGWKIFCHHMTIVFGKGIKNKEDLGKLVSLRVTDLGLSDMAMAVKVSGYETTNDIPHITIAINPDGGKPKDSNLITNWCNIKPFNITGVIKEIKRDN